MQTPASIEQARSQERDRKIILLHEQGQKSFRQIAAEFGITEGYVKQLILNHHRTLISKNAEIYARMAQASGAVTWAAPAPESSVEDLPLVELKKALSNARQTGEQVMLAVVIIPSDNSVDYNKSRKGAAA